MVGVMPPSGRSRAIETLIVTPFGPLPTVTRVMNSDPSSLISRFSTRVAQVAPSPTRSQSADRWRLPYEAVRLRCPDARSSSWGTAESTGRPIQVPRCCRQSVSAASHGFDPAAVTSKLVTYRTCTSATSPGAMDDKVPADCCPCRRPCQRNRPESVVACSRSTELAQRRGDSVRRSPHDFARLRMRLGCTTPKAAPTGNVIPSQSGLPLVGVTGFEPAPSSSRTKRATKLRHTPMPRFLRSLKESSPIHGAAPIRDAA